MSESRSVNIEGLVPISVNHYYSYRTLGKGIVKKFLTKQGKDFKFALAQKVSEQSPLDGDLYVMIEYRFPDRRRRDIDNYNKCTLDAMNQLLWYDDSQIQVLQVTKKYDKEHPGISVDVYQDHEAYKLMRCE